MSKKKVENFMLANIFMKSDLNSDLEPTFYKGQNESSNEKKSLIKSRIVETEP